MDTIGTFLGVAEIPEDEITKNEIVETTKEIDAANKNAKFDEAAEYVNSNLKEIIDSSMESLPGLFRVMADSEDSKMYQVGAAFIKTLSEINKTYYEVNKPIGGIDASNNNKKSGDQSQQNIQINGNVQMVSPRDLLD